MAHPHVFPSGTPPLRTVKNIASIDDATRGHQFLKVRGDKCPESGPLGEQQLRVGILHGLGQVAGVMQLWETLGCVLVALRVIDQTVRAGAELPYSNVQCRRIPHVIGVGLDR